MSRPRLLAIGGAHPDRRGRMTAHNVPGTSVPGAMREEIGGGAFNAALAAARRGVAVALLSLRGGDAAGALVASAIAEAGIADLSSTYLDRATPTYTAILDRDGAVVAALADMDLYEQFARHLARRAFRDAVVSADAVLVDANLPAAALASVAARAAGRPVHAIAVSPAKAPRLAALLPMLDALFMTRAEAASLTELPFDAPPAALARALAARGLRRGIVTDGARPATLLDHGTVASIAPPPARVEDVTGAGDALAGAAVAATMAGAPFRAAVMAGMAAALLAVESAQAAPRLDEAAFAAALARVMDAQAVDEKEDAAR